jgi:hypothetical protein
VHFFGDRSALVEREREVAEGGPTVSAMLFSTAIDTPPKTCPNTELGDAAG